MGNKLKSRRDFLKPSAGKDVDVKQRLLRLGRPAMGSRFEVAVRSEDRGFVRDIHASLREISRLEGILSVFKGDSDLGRMNETAAAGWFKPGPDLWDALTVSLDYCRATGGAMDITCGALWKLWGFYSRNPGVPSDLDIEIAIGKTGFCKVRIREETREVKYLEPGLEINLGATGKGYALDRASSILQNKGLRNFLINAGNSSFYASGSLVEKGRGWKIGIRDPRCESSRDFARVMLRDQALATSGAGVQFFEHDGSRFGHVIDPGTGRPAGRYLSATAIADNALAADALSTAFFTMDISGIEDFCGKNPDTGALLISGDETGTVNEYHMIGTAEDLIEIV